MKKYFILTNYSEYYNNKKIVLLKAESESSAFAYINRTIDKIVRESVLAGLRIVDVERADYTDSAVSVVSIEEGGVVLDYNFRILEIDSVADYDKWYIFSKEVESDSIDVDIVADGLSACEKFAEKVDDAAEAFSCKSAINWTLRTAKVGDSLGDYEIFVMMSVQEMLEIK